ncbi:hypothetical protein AZE42_01023 [Rhizopogon vesiculosus]|uniref:Uncharacterized protein n=1 Tax=Rhizopogon vesiculosus TaxID=180088 RepID=A0A1J8PP37_9AGAM|nr:hypothetical protein AZE42_01023 [Rhizopogon vesiculosus]
MSVTTTYTFQYTLSSLTSDYGAIWDERRRILITSNKPAVSAPESAPPFTQHPMTRGNARRPVKRSAENTSLHQHVPESPISYHPSTVHSMPQCKVPIKPGKPASSHAIPSPDMLAMLQEVDELINGIHDPTLREELANILAVCSTTAVYNSSTSPVEQVCRSSPHESPIIIPVAAGTPVVKPLYRYRSLPDIPSPPPRSRVFPTSVSFKSFFRRLRSSVKSDAPDKHMRGWQEAI